MAKIVVSYPGERVVSEITALVKRPATPSVAQAPHIGLVQISEIQPTDLIPGPPGAQGPRGSRWYTGDGPPASISGVVTGDMYLDNLTDEVWTYTGTAWVDTGTNIHGSPDTGLEILAKLAPVDGAGSGLDADLLDGQHGAFYQDYANQTNKPATYPPTLPIAQSGVTNLVSDLALKAPLASPLFTGDPRAPTPATSDSDTSVATTAYVKANITGIVSFPEAPNDGLTYGRKSLAWATIVGGAVVSDTAPPGPLQAGQFWYQSSTGNTYLWVTDADSSQWVQQNVMPPGQTPLDNLQSTTADMSIGFKTGGNRFVVNDGPSLNGTDVMTVTEAGAVTVTGAATITGNCSTTTGYVISNPGYFLGSTSLLTLGTQGAGTINLRPNGYASATGQTTIDSAGGMTVASNVTAANFLGSGPNVNFTNGSAGTLYFRPNGAGSGAGLMTLNSAGTLDLSAGISTGSNITVVSPFSSTGAVAGITIGGGAFYQTSKTGTTSASHFLFYNANGLCGSINTNASATQYNTSSDERLKDFIGPYDPQEAITIIRADPVRAFTWKVDSTPAVGWGAQTSYAISPDLASPPPDELLSREPGDEDFQPWGIDQGKRTPYLWAALSWALAEIDTLKAKVAALEAPGGV